MTEEEATTAVARGMFPSADWDGDHLAFVQCPGIDLHTGSNGRKDCRLTINDGRPPTLFCVHQSCSDILAQRNKAMRSAIGKLKSATQTGNHARAGMAPVTSAPRASTATPTRAMAQPVTTRVPLAAAPLPAALADGQRLHLETCFDATELVAVVRGVGPAGKPLNIGDIMPPVPLVDDHDNGTFVRVNPMRIGGRGDADVTAWRHCLIECDQAPLELQWAAIQASRLPVAVVVHSGGRSVHAWVRVDASTAEEFRQRAAAAADALDKFDGIKVDRSALNPSRWARLAGRRRGDAMQELLAVNIGATCWDDWVAMAKEQPAVEPLAVEAPRQPSAVQFYYRKHQKDYLLVRDNNTNVVPLNEAGLKSALKFEGLVEIGDKEGLERAAYDIKLETGIDYDGPMPGYCRGLHVESGQRCFVNSEPTPVVGVPVNRPTGEDVGKEWPTIHALLTRLLVDPGAEPMAMLNLCWSLKLSREALAQALQQPADGDRNVRPGPVTVFCGPKNCGKTLLVNHVITPLLGGRFVDAHKSFQSDADGFNGELLAGEVWIVDDKIHSCDLKSRRQFAANIKSKLYAGKVGFHAKFKEQITITPWARLFVCCNDQDEAIRVLPVLTDDLADKMHLFRCYSAAEDLATQTAAEWTAYGAALKAELPAFAGWVDALEIPPRYRTSRNGMRCWQDHHIVSLLADQTPEHQLALLLSHLFDTGQFATQHNKTAQEILEHLEGIESVKFQVGSLLHHDPALLGRYLGRLVGDAPRLKMMGLTLERTGRRRESWMYTVGTLHA